MGDRVMPENLFCNDMKAASNKYRKGWDRIEWAAPERQKEPEPSPTRKELPIFDGTTRGEK